MKKVIAIIILLLILLLLAGGFFIFKPYLDSLNEPYSSDSLEDMLIEIPMGSTTTDIAAILKENGIIGDEFKFKLLSRLKKYDG